MANNLSYSVAVNLLTEKFNQGKTQLISGFNELKSTALQMAGVFGLGLGLTHTIEKMIDVAKESAAVNKALKVASGGFSEYAQNQKYVIDLSNRLGLSVNEMTGAFAKFSASAKTSNIPLKSQQALFTGLNEAMLAVGAKPEAKAEALDAVSKMMQKGQITTKMLIGGLGSALPESLSIMAKSLGVSTDKLRDMAKHGTLLASDVMPKFAAELEKSFGNVDTDTIGGAFNRIGNDFEELTKKLNVGSTYKNIVKAFEGGFHWIVENFELVGNAIVNIVSTVIIGKAFAAAKKGFADVTLAAETEFVKQSTAAAKSALIQELEASGLSRKEIAYYKATEFAILESNAKAEFSTKGFFSSVGAGTALFKNLGTAISASFKAFAPMIIISGLIAIGEKLYNIYSENKRIKDIWEDYQKGFKNAGSGNDKHSQDLKSQADLYHNMKLSVEERKTALQGINSILGTNYQYDVNNKKIQDDINNKIKDRLKLYQQEAQFKYMVDEGAKAKGKLSDIKNKVDEDDEQIKIYKSRTQNYDNYSKSKNFNPYSDETKNKYNQYLADKEQLRMWTNQKEVHQEEYNQDKKVTDRNDITLNKFLTANPDLKRFLEGGDNTKVDDKIDPKKERKDLIQKEEDSIQKELTEIDNELKNSKRGADGKYTEEALKKYNEQFDKIQSKALEKLQKLLTPEEAKNDNVYKDAKKSVEHPLTSYDDKLKDVYNEYTTKLNDAITYKKATNESDVEFNKKQKELIKKTVENITALGNVTPAAQKLIDGFLLLDKSLDVKDFQLPERKKIDHTFDYKKSDVEKQQNQVDNQIDYKDSLVDSFKTATGDGNIEDEIKKANGDLTGLISKFGIHLGTMIVLINEEMKKSVSMSDALKLAQAKKDVKDLQKQLQSGLYGSVKEVAGSAKNLYSSFKAVKDTFNNLNSKPFEKIVALWDLLTNSIDNIMSIVKSIQSLLKITQELGDAKKIESGIETGTATAKIATNAALTASNAQLMAAETAAAYSYIPFAGQGLALAQIGVLQGAILAAGVPKLANGGVVYGNSLVNVGEYAGAGSNPEVIAPLDKLKSLIKTPETSGVGGKVDFVIDGKVIKGVLKNYDNVKSKVN